MMRLNGRWNPYSQRATRNCNEPQRRGANARYREVIMRAVVYGAGGAGGYFGAQLALSGEQVVFVARGEHLKALRANGLRLETPKGDTVIRPVEATDDPATVTAADVVLGVKAWQVRDAAQALRPLVDGGAFVVPLQNGVDAISQLLTIPGEEHVLGGMCGT